MTAKKCPSIPFTERMLPSRESSALLMPVTPMARNVSTSWQGPGVQPTEGWRKWSMVALVKYMKHCQMEDGKAFLCCTELRLKRRRYWMRGSRLM